VFSRHREPLVWLAVAMLSSLGFWWAGRNRDPAPPSGKTVITWYAMINTLRDLYVEEAAQFERLHPDLRVRIVWAPGSEYNTKLKTLAAAGRLPDLFYGGDVWLSYQLPLMRDLTPYVERDAAEIGLDDYFPAIRAAMRLDGRTYILPESLNLSLLYYNRRLFAEAGLAEPSESWTWDDLVRAGRVLTRPAGPGRPGVWGCARVEGWWGEWLIDVRQAGGRVFTPDGRRCLLDSPAAIAGLRFYLDKSRKYGISAPPGFEPANGFVNQRTAMVFGGHVGFWLLYDAAPGLDWDAQMLPAGPAGRKGGELAIAGYSISRTCPHPEAAWELAKFITRREAVAAIVAQGGVSVRRSVAEQALRAAGKGSAPPRNLAAVYRQFDYGEPIPHNAYFIEIMFDFIQPEVDRMLLGEVTPEEAGRRATEAVNAFLENFAPESS
jgi:multiple sugar transport system substrate-binding protein